MNFIDLAKKRHSTRTYNPEPLSRKEIEEILTAAQLAPSACNKQPWKFYVVTNKEAREKMLAKSRPGFLDAPVVIVAVGIHSESWHRPSDGKDHTDVDVSIAVEHICLAAAELDIDTCWVCSFDVSAVKEALNLSEDQEPIALIPMGKNTTPASEKTRKSLHEIVEYVE